MKPITYLREGRKLRASGRVITTAAGLTKVKPERPDWGHVWLSSKEIEAGKEKPAYQPKPKKETAPDKPKRQRKPKIELPPRWKQLVAEVRTLEIDHAPEGWPCIRMATVSDLANELESAQAKLTEFLPIAGDVATAPQDSEPN